MIAHHAHWPAFPQPLPMSEGHPTLGKEGRYPLSHGAYYCL